MNESLCSSICSRAPDLGSRDFGFSQWIGTDLTLRDFRKRFMGFGASFSTGEASSSGRTDGYKKLREIVSEIVHFSTKLQLQ